MRADAAALVSSAITTYTAQPESVHEQLSRCDFVARIALSLCLPGALANSDFHPNVSLNPGLGTIKGTLRDIETQNMPELFKRVARIGVVLLSTDLPSGDLHLRTIVQLRDHLFHGGPLPDSPTCSSIANKLVEAIATASNDLRDALTGWTIEGIASNEGPLRAILRHEESGWDLSPLIALSPTSKALLVFARVTSSEVTLSASRYEPRQAISRTDCELSLGRVFRFGKKESLVADYTQAALEDLEGFRERGSGISYNQSSEGVCVVWTHADGANPSQRVDRLRIGPNNMWQWHSEAGWVGYLDLLRQLAHWHTLSSRIRNALSAQIAKNRSDENEYLPLPDGTTVPYIFPSMLIGRIGIPVPDECSLRDFVSRLDADVQANRGTTCLYFVHAEAGAGKTTALMQIAFDRVSDLMVSDVGSDVPLFLYISARGNVLEDLDRAVNATVAETRILTSDSVRALCRNGLMIPIIDGFDELVGSPTYSDALASLRPWLKGLGGRGVLVVSARSSYFVSLYEESIRRASNKDISVWHFIAKLDKWSIRQRDEYLRHFGIDDVRRSGVSEAEMDLLRLPFFARASVPFLLRVRNESSSSLSDELMWGYVDREHSKLQGPTGDYLITSEQLNGIFEEVALWMMEQSTRDVELADLQTAAGVAFGSNLSGVLTNRLVALCGLDTHGEGARRFRFSHEIFLDVFFGRRVGRELCTTSDGVIERIISKCRLSVGSVRVAALRCRISVERLNNVTASVTRRWSVESPMSANLGLLWNQAVRSEPSLSSITLTRIDIERMEIRRTNLDNVLFDQCSFGSLTVAPGSARSVRFVKCTMQELVLEAGNGLSFEDCVIDTALSTSPSSYGDDPEAIEGLVLATGARISRSTGRQSEGQPSIVNDARFFLEKIHSRVETSIVLGRNRLPVDNAQLGWATRRGSQWQLFVKTLESHGLAALVPITAGGAKKFRLRLEVPAIDILIAEGSMPNVAQFWASLYR